MKKINFKKKTVKKSTAIFITVAVVLVVGLVGFLSNGFTNGDVNSWVQERNPDNLLTYEMPVEDFLVGDGTTLNITKDGTIKVTGKIAQGTGTWSYGLGDILLEAGEYTLTCSDECNMNTYIIVGTYVDENGATQTWYSDRTDTKTIELAKDTTVTFSLRIFEKGNVNIVARPVLASGDEAISFYVPKTVKADK